MNMIYETSDLILFSSQRWNKIPERSRYIMSSFAHHRRVYYFEDAIFGITDVPRIYLRETPEGLIVVEPYLPATLKDEEIHSAMKDLLDELIYEEEIRDVSIWYQKEELKNLFSHIEASIVMDSRIVFEQDTDLAPDQVFMKLSDMERETPKVKSSNFFIHKIHPIMVNMFGGL